MKCDILFLLYITGHKTDLSWLCLPDARMHFSTHPDRINEAVEQILQIPVISNNKQQAWITERTSRTGYFIRLFETLFKFERLQKRSKSCDMECLFWHVAWFHKVLKVNVSSACLFACLLACFDICCGKLAMNLADFKHQRPSSCSVLFQGVNKKV